MSLMLTQGNALRIPLADESVHCVVTSPPYWGLRDYGIEGQMGLEKTPEQYVANMVAVFREVKRVMRHDATLWLNMGDSYASSPKGSIVIDNSTLGGSKTYQAEGTPPGLIDKSKVAGLKPKDLCGIPWRLAFALQSDGWWLRQHYPWVKVNPMPESAEDRPNSAVEFMFLLTKSARYYFDMEGAKECLAITRNWRNGDGMLLLDCPTFAYSSSVETSHLAHVLAHEVDGGMIHIILPGCPDHGDQFVPLAKEFYGEGEADYWNHIEHICNRLAQVPFGDCAPTDQQRALGYSEQSSGYYPRSYSPTAIDHNNETHRMALALDSTVPYIPFFEIAPRIDDKRVLLSSFVQHLCIYGNSILKDGCDAHLLERIPYHIVDKSSLFLTLTCTCNYYRYYTRKPDHFATYPPALVEPCIKAGTSERGVCPECGAPWERVVERFGVGRGEAKNAPTDYKKFTDKEEHVKTGYGETGMGGGHKRQEWLNVHPYITLGWQRTCECGTMEPPIPATVFDPFAGSGTTLQVARRLGRNGVGLDLSLEYLHLARQRLSLDALEAWTEGVGHSDNGKDGTHKNKQVPRQVHSFHAARKEKGVTDLPMFEEMP